MMMEYSLPSDNPSEHKNPARSAKNVAVFPFDTGFLRHWDDREERH